MRKFGRRIVTFVEDLGSTISIFFIVVIIVFAVLPLRAGNENLRAGNAALREQITVLTELNADQSAQLACRSKATIEKDLAQIAADGAVLVGLTLLVDKDRDGVAESPGLQSTLDRMLLAESDLRKAGDARAGDLAALGDACGPR